MRDTLIHRGPDDEGIYIDGPVGLAHRRLSIVGISTGHQPMNNGTDRLWIVFNGEIYNYRALRKTLEGKGYDFRTQSDTEVILHLYSEYGEDCVLHLNGMFSFVIWDKAAEQIFMARDRLGEKPLYFAETDDAYIFASEVKALLKYPGLTAHINADAVYEYFLFRAVAGEHTLFSDVRSLSPGSVLMLKSGRCRTRTYWDSRRLPVNWDVSPREAEVRLHELLVDSIKLRLMSEVPLGTFCSGGVDSSLVTAIAAQAIGHPINTFSVGFHETEFDETDYARMVSKRYSTTHHELKIDNQEFTEFLPGLVYLNDGPLNFSNSVHIYALSRLAKDFVTVVLTGEGADELFLGYPRYHLPQLALILRRLHLIVIPLMRIVPAVQRDHRYRKLLCALMGDFDETLVQNSAVNGLEMVDALVHPSVSREIDYRKSLLESTYDMDSLISRISMLDQRTYLVSILNRQDKMSMGASVEARVPFLDHRIVEFANSLPARTKIRGLRTKTLVKNVAMDYLPAQVVHRRKSGFGVPLDQWLRDSKGLGGLAERLIFDVPCDEYLDSAQLKVLFHEHSSGAGNHGEILWTALNFLLWKEQYGV